MVCFEIIGSGLVEMVSKFAVMRLASSPFKFSVIFYRVLIIVPPGNKELRRFD